MQLNQDIQYQSLRHRLTSRPWNYLLRHINLTELHIPLSRNHLQIHASIFILWFIYQLKARRGSTYIHILK